MIRTCTPFHRYLLVFPVALLAACGGDGVSPEPLRVAATLEVLGGDEQDGQEDTPLADELIVRVLDQDRRPMSGVSIVWSVTAGGGSIEALAPTTGGDGRARAIWTLGEAGQNTATAAVADRPALAAAFRATAVTAPRGVVLAEISAGTNHTCGLSTMGTAFCWGNNAQGGIGDGTLARRLSPTPVGGDVVFQSISAGYDFTCGIVTDGRAYFWGRNTGGQLGDGTNTDRSSPVAVLGGLRFSTLSAGHDHTCGITTDTVPMCWGNNAAGQLGDGTTTARVLPTRVAGDLVLTTVTAGHTHSCGLTAAGDAYCWGLAGNGRLGNGVNSSFPQPTPVAVSGGHAFDQVSIGDFHTCARRTDGVAFCWGEGPTGQLGAGGVIQGGGPTAVAGDLRFTTLEAGRYHTCGVTIDGAVFCWGRNEDGQVGDGSMSHRFTPMAVADGAGFARVRPATVSTCALDDHGGGFCWGNNSGRFGNGQTASSLTPTPVVFP
jgi:hypothetical protein